MQVYRYQKKYELSLREKLRLILIYTQWLQCGHMGHIRHLQDNYPIQSVFTSLAYLMKLIT
jgi:hypothetical protein